MVNIKINQYILKTIFLAFCFVSFLCWLKYSPNRPMNYQYPDSQFYVATLLRGDAPFSEISQDAYGFRALVNGWNAYIPLTDALPNIHENWSLPITHPPTAFFFALPVAFMDDSKAATVWSWICLCTIMLSLFLHGFNFWEVTIFTIVSIFWLPTIGSLGQLTPIWLLGLSIAYYFRERNPTLSGIFISLASMTKFMPALLLIPFLVRRKKSALLSFSLLWIMGLLLIAYISPKTFSQYIQANIIATPFFIEQSGSFIISLNKNLGIGGVLTSIIFLLLIIISNWKELFLFKEVTTKTWMIFSYFAIALLPITWGYSYFPLYPGLIIICKSKQPFRILGFIALICFSIFPFGAMIFYGLGLMWPESMSFQIMKIPGIKSCLIPILTRTNSIGSRTSSDANNDNK